MGNLLNEYRRRHNSNFIWGSSDGVCFFNKNRKPAAICLLTDMCRAGTVCDYCSGRQPRFVCEVFTLNRWGSREPLKILAHDHIDVDIDVSKFMSKLDANFVPYHAKDQKDIEAWVWNFFLQLQPFSRCDSYIEFAKKQDKKDSNTMRSLEQMIWAATNMPEIFSVYYARFYQLSVIGRNYLLYK